MRDIDMHLYGSMRESASNKIAAAREFEPVMRYAMMRDVQDLGDFSDFHQATLRHAYDLMDGLVSLIEHAYQLDAREIDSPEHAEVRDLADRGVTDRSDDDDEEEDQDQKPGGLMGTFEDPLA